MFCVNCGQKIPDSSVLCPNCGHTLPQNGAQGPGQPPPASSPVAPPPSYPPPPAQPNAAYVPLKRRKRHGCLTAFIVVLVLLVLAAAALYFFVPGLLRPNDLGVKTSSEAYTSAMTKLGVRKDEAPKSGTEEDYTYTYGPPQDVDTGLTSEELTSFFNENRPPYYPVKNVEVRINDDGTIEASGRLDTSYVFDVILSGQYSREDAQKELPMLGLIPNNINVYFMFSGSVEDNQVIGLDIDSAKIMGIPVPQSLIDSADFFITETLDGYIERECAKVGAYVEHLAVSDGRIDFKGSLPSSVTRTPVG